MVGEVGIEEEGELDLDMVWGWERDGGRFWGYDFREVGVMAMLFRCFSFLVIVFCIFLVIGL